MKTSSEIYNGTIPMYNVIYMRHNAGKLMVQFNYQLVETSLINEDHDEEPHLSLQFDYVIVDKLRPEILQQAQVPQNVIDEIFTPNTQLWHEPAQPIRIYFTIEDMETLLAAHPDMARHSVINHINYYVQGGGVYNYVKFLFPEHQFLIEQYNGIITNTQSS